MIDSVLKGTGNSRFLKSAVPAGTSWADALAMLQAGTFPIDFNGINTEGFQQVGTPLNKANLLKDTTAAQIGLPTSTTPDGMFQALGNTGELHVWKKTITSGTGTYSLGAVIGVPAGTTTTYPVSTNPNAYQEGDDAKAAGYTLGEVKTGSFAITSKSSPGGVGTRWNDSATLSVSDDGTCTLATTGGIYIDGTTTNAATTAKNELQGKFAYCNNTDTDFASSVIVFFPSNTIFTKVGNIVYADRYQPVTGYAAIPASTTIEYLGKLGDKSRVQVVSYVGTGTYGERNPNSLTFDFVPKMVIISKITADSAPWALFLPPILSGTYSGRAYNITGVTTTQTDSFAKINKKTLSWFSTNGFTPQLNSQSDKYTAIAIG